MSRVQCFGVEAVPFAQESLRRFVFSGPDATPCVAGHYHNAIVQLGEVTRPLPVDCYESAGEVDRADPRWPTKCEHCDYVFTEEDQWQHNFERQYGRPEAGERWARNRLPPGAMYDACWQHDFWAGDDGRSLIVTLPDGVDWCVDSRATNCSKPDDKTHHCWMRQGVPPDITVVGSGCGSFSIQSPGYHGYLRAGWLEQC